MYTIYIMNNISLLRVSDVMNRIGSQSVNSFYEPSFRTHGRVNLNKMGYPVKSATDSGEAELHKDTPLSQYNFIKKRVFENMSSQLASLNNNNNVPIESEITRYSNNQDLKRIDRLIEKLHLNIQTGSFFIQTVNDMYELLNLFEQLIYKLDYDSLKEYKDYLKTLFDRIDSNKTEDIDKIVKGDSVQSLNLVKLIHEIYKRIKSLFKLMINNYSTSVAQRKRILETYLKSPEFRNFSDKYHKVLAGRYDKMQAEQAKAKGEKKALLTEQLDLLRGILDYSRRQEASRTEEAGRTPAPSGVTPSTPGAPPSPMFPPLTPLPIVEEESAPVGDVTLADTTLADDDEDLYADDTFHPETINDYARTLFHLFQRLTDEILSDESMFTSIDDKLAFRKEVNVWIETMTNFLRMPNEDAEGNFNMDKFQAFNNMSYEMLGLLETKSGEIAEYFKEEARHVSEQIMSIPAMETVNIEAMTSSVAPSIADVSIQEQIDFYNQHVKEEDVDFFKHGYGDALKGYFDILLYKLWSNPDYFKDDWASLNLTVSPKNGNLYVKVSDRKLIKEIKDINEEVLVRHIGTTDGTLYIKYPNLTFEMFNILIGRKIEEINVFFDSLESTGKKHQIEIAFNSKDEIFVLQSADKSGKTQYRIGQLMTCHFATISSLYKKFGGAQNPDATSAQKRLGLIQEIFNVLGTSEGQKYTVTLY